VDRSPRPNNFPIELVYFSGRRYSLAVDGTITRDDITWTPDDKPENWARWWLFYHWPEPVNDGGLWGDGSTWGDGGPWGSAALTVDDARDLQLVPTEWNAAHATGRVVLLHEGAELWGYPVGTWGDAGTWGGPVQFPIR
jgi:hypothetical protein